MGNLRIRRWFDSGEVVDAVLGQGRHFIPDYSDVAEHDRILVLGELLQWAGEGGRKAEAAAAISTAVDRRLSVGDYLAAVDILWCYFLVADDARIALPLDCPSLRDRLTAARPAHHAWPLTERALTERLDACAETGS